MYGYSQSKILPVHLVDLHMSRCTQVLPPTIPPLRQHYRVGTQPPKTSPCKGNDNSLGNFHQVSPRYIASRPTSNRSNSEVVHRPRFFRILGGGWHVKNGNSFTLLVPTQKQQRICAVCYSSLGQCQYFKSWFGVNKH